MGDLKQRIDKPTTEAYLNELDISLNNGDFFNKVDGPNGSSFYALSLHPFKMDVTKQSIVRFKKAIEFPGYVETENSISLRNAGSVFCVECNDGIVNGVVYPEINVASIGQTVTPLLTITLGSIYNGFIGDWIDIYSKTSYGVNSTMNYGNLVVKSISTNKLVLTCSVASESNIQAVALTTITPANLFIRKQNRLAPFRNAIGIRYSGGSHTVLSPYSKFNNGSIKVAGTLTGAQTVTGLTTVPVYNSAVTGQVDLKPTNRYKFEVDGENAIFRNFAVDTPARETTITTFSSVRPSIEDTKYYLNYRGYLTPSVSRPICRVKSISKPISSPVATVVTDVAHLLGVGTSIKIYGVVDITNFTPTTATVASIISPTSFTVSYGATPASAVTSYGGFVAVINGGLDISGLTAGTVTNAVRDINGYVTLTNSANWAGYGGIGEYVELYGCLNSDGTDPLLDGTYQVNDVTTTTMILEPIKDPLGVVVKNGAGNSVTPIGGVVSTAPRGGYVLLRPTMRFHDLVACMYSNETTRILGQGTDDPNFGLPVYSLGGSVGVTGTITNTPTTPSTSMLTAAATTNGSLIKSTAGTLYGIQVSNPTAATMYLKLYNKASAPTVGTDVPVFIIPIPTTAGALLALDGHGMGYRFSTGIAIAITGAIANDTTAVVTAGGQVMISYL